MNRANSGTVDHANPSDAPRLRPLVGAFTASLIGTGVAIGSGIFRNPGLVAQNARHPLWMMAAWLFGGVFFTFAGLLIAELATRFPRSGGEYVYLRHAYGDFVAFFFGWAYTVFIVGGGIATMAVAFGDFTCNMLQRNVIHIGGHAVGLSGLFGAGAILAVTAVNLLGLRTGAYTQDVFTLAKVAALLAIVFAAGLWGRPVEWSAAVQTHDAGGGLRGWLGLFAGAMMPVMWCYDGTTDSAKITEEVRDSRRSMPRALIGANVLVTVVYMLINFAFLRVLTPGEMAGSELVAASVLERLLGHYAGRAIVGLSMLVVLGAISSTTVACVRVPFALGRDGLTFRALGRMSSGQAPVAALLVVAGLAVSFTLMGVYEQVLSVYTISSGVLFGLVNLSLVVFRMRDRWGAAGEADHFRCPAGIAVAVMLAGVQFVIAVGTAVRFPVLARYTVYALVGIALLYFVWPKPREGVA